MGTPAAADPLQDAMALLINTMSTFAGSQSHFLRAAVAADQNISLSLATPLLYSEVLEAKAIDNTVDDRHRNGLRASHRDLRESMPHDYVFDAGHADYDPTDPRHGTDWGRGDDEVTQERTDNLSTWHRNRGRTILSLSGLLPADGYMNPASSVNDQQRQYKAHPLTLKGTLNEGDVRKGECVFPEDSSRLEPLPPNYRRTVTIGDEGAAGRYG